MTIEEFRHEVLFHYLDRDLLVALDRDPSEWSTGNGLLHLGLFMVVLYRQGILDGSTAAIFDKAVNQCYVKDLLKQPILGLLNRNPGRTDMESRDDYIGVAAASALLCTRHAPDIRKYGEQNGFNYNNQDPGKFTWNSWHGRFLGLPGFYAMCAGKNPGIVQNMALKLKLFFYPKEFQGEILMWVMTQVLKRLTPQYDGLINRFEKHLTQKYPNLGSLFLPYFGESHPFSKLEIRIK